MGRGELHEARVINMKFIFEVRMKPGYTADEYAAAWVRASEVIQQSPGARGTLLHRKIGEPDTLLAIASWDSKAHRDAKDDRRSALVQSILEAHASRCEVRVIGEFEEPEWAVMPPYQQPQHHQFADPFQQPQG
jgi:hypothetical protein